jgi:hypothetical protein
MADGKKRLERALKQVLDAKQNVPIVFKGALGAYINGLRTIPVAGREGFVWVRLRSSTSEVIQAFNDAVAHHWELPVLVERDPELPGLWKIRGRDVAQYDDWGEVAYLPPHGQTHSLAGGPGVGSDPVFVFKRQWMPLLPRPLPTATTSIFIEADYYYWEGEYRYWPGSATSSLTPFLPTGSSNGRFVTVYLDGDTGNPGYLAGPEFNLTFAPDDPTEFISVPTPDQGIPIAAVRLTTGTGSGFNIGWNEIVDLRIVSVAPDQTGSAVTVFDDGILLGEVQGFNFVGSGVEAVISGSYAHIIHTGSAVSVPATGSIVLLEDGGILGSITELDVEGDGIDASISGTRGLIRVTGSASASNIIILDDGIVLGAATHLDFEGAGVSATISGAFVSVNIPGGGSSDGTGTCTYVRAGNAEDLVGITGQYWKVPGDEYSTGTLSVALNGIWQRPGTDFSEQFPASGTFQFSESPATGSFVSVIWGEPCDSGGGGSATVEPPVTGSVVLLDEGSILGSVTELDFVGAGVSATITGTRGTVDIPGGGGGTGSSGGASIYSDTYANIPAAGTEGDLFLPTDGYAVYRDDGADWIPWGPIFPMTVPPATGWSWVNQSTSFIEDADGGLFLVTSGSAGSESLRAYVQSLPGPSGYTIEAGAWVTQNLLSSGVTRTGVAVRDSATGRLTVIWVSRDSGSRIQVSRYNSPTSFNTHLVNSTLQTASTSFAWWFRIMEVAGNLIYQISPDRRFWVTLTSEAVGAFLTPDQVGIAVVPRTDIGSIHLRSWDVS